MSKAIHPRDLPAYLTKRQGDQSATAYAASLHMSRQYLTMLLNGSYLPSPRCLAGMNLEVVLQIKDSGRIIRLADLGAYLTKLQGKQSEVDRAAELGLTRQHYHQIRAGLTAMPAAWAIEKLGMEIMYREIARKR